MTRSLQDLKPNRVIRLDRPEDGARSAHLWSAREIDALILAHAADRPLLVRGEPGTGKTQLARAAAQHLGWELRTETIHPRYEPQDLIFRFDAIRRLADANRAGKTDLEDADYWEPGPLWRAYGWDSARRYGSCRDARAPEGTVILIDEIDKADSELPNSLLEVLGQRSFTIGGLRLKVGPLPEGAPKPLVIVTTNEERELPPAFLRRCIVLNLGPERNMDYGEWLVERGRAHFDKEAKDRTTGPWLHDDVLKGAADQLVVDRKAAVDAGLHPPGPAEYLDLLYALHRLAPARTDDQIAWLERLSRYAFIKHAETAVGPTAAAGGSDDGPLTQRRKPVKVTQTPAVASKAAAPKRRAAAR